MKFLLQTVIEWESQLVYYAIYRYPKQIAAAVDFHFYWKTEWLSEAITDRQLYRLGETVKKYLD